MLIPPLPSNEAERLRALREYDILDTPIEASFDALTQLLARILNVPIALVSIIDAERQWFKSRIGLSGTETSRATSFCGHIVSHNHTLIVPDARADDRFADNPHVIGEPRVCFYAGAPLRSEDGHVLGTLCAIDRVPRTLTPDQEEVLNLLANQVTALLELRHQQRMLMHAKESAEHAARARSDFLARMSHEIRTPMNGVLGMLELIAESGLGVEQHEQVAAARSSAESLLAIINDVLDFSKIDAGKLRIESTGFDLRACLDGIVRGLSASARAKGLQLSLDIASDVPNGLVGDPHRVRQVLVNLIGNALKFTERGHVRVRCRLTSLNSHGAKLCFEVEDTGIGIEPGKQHHIFQAFSQADEATSRRYGGTGLGLTISFELVQAMGGTLSVLRSELGRGSCFGFELPFARGPLAGSRRTEAPHAQHATGPRRILLAEDNIINQKVAVALLRKHGHQVTVVGTGRAAVQAVQASDFDVVLMDMQMPTMDGFEAMRAIRQLESGGARRTPIIALTAQAMEGDRERCLANGADAYVPKPLDARKLSATIAELTEPASAV